MISFSKAIAGVVGATALLAGSATAAEYRVSVLGTIVDGFDDAGVFGAPGSLTGRAFTATYIYDTNSSVRDIDPGVSDLIEPIKASLRINGVTYDFPDFSILTSYALAQPGSLSFEHFNAVDANPVDLQTISSIAYSAAFGPSLDLAGGTYGVDGGGGFDISICCCPACGDDFTDIYAYGEFDLDFVRLAVPEPTTWAAMLLGFGMAGAGLRRRRVLAA